MSEDVSSIFFLIDIIKNYVCIISFLIGYRNVDEYVNIYLLFVSILYPFWYSFSFLFKLLKYSHFVIKKIFFRFIFHFFSFILNYYFKNCLFLIVILNIFFVFNNYFKNLFFFTYFVFPILLIILKINYFINNLHLTIILKIFFYSNSYFIYSESKYYWT